jgi:hypothetical protein
VLSLPQYAALLRKLWVILRGLPVKSFVKFAASGENCAPIDAFEYFQGRPAWIGVAKSTG